MTGNVFAFPWEIPYLVFLQSIVPEMLVPVFSMISSLGESTAFICILGFVYWTWDKELGVRIGINTMLAGTFNAMLKNVALRLRPYMVDKEVKLFKIVSPGHDPMDVVYQGYSFPSGHSSLSAGLYGTIACYSHNPVIIAVCIITILLIGFSRNVLGAHYPTDVLTGFLLALMTIFLLPYVEKALKTRKKYYLFLVLVTFPGMFYCKTVDYYQCIGLLYGLILSVPLEERFVRFSVTRKPVRMVVRTVLGIVLIAILKSLLKKPFSAEFLNSGSQAALLVQGGRYFLISVFAFYIYPLLFTSVARIENKRK